MKKQHKLLTGALVIGIGSLLLGTSAQASMKGQVGPQNDTERAAIEQALTSGNYSAFKTALSSKPKPADAPEITETVFAKMVEAHKLRLAGDNTGAEKIMSDLGFKKGPHNDGKGKLPIDESSLTASQKVALAQAKTLFESGKKDEAKSVLDNAGIKPKINHLQKKNNTIKNQTTNQ